MDVGLRKTPFQAERGRRPATTVGVRKLQRLSFRAVSKYHMSSTLQTDGRHARDTSARCVHAKSVWRRVASSVAPYYYHWCDLAAHVVTGSSVTSADIVDNDKIRRPAADNDRVTWVILSLAATQWAAAFGWTSPTYNEQNTLIIRRRCKQAVAFQFYCKLLLITAKTTLPFSRKQTTRECIYLRSYDLDLNIRPWPKNEVYRSRHSKGRARTGRTDTRFFPSCDLDLDSMTSMCELDLYNNNTVAWSHVT